MQEEIENRTVNLAISTSKLTARTIVSAVRMYLYHRKGKTAEKTTSQPTGKQTVKELLGQGQGVTNIDIAQTDLRGFESVARKYGIDYAIRKDSSVDPPKYLVFFKSKDADAMTAAFNQAQLAAEQAAREAAERAAAEAAAQTGESQSTEEPEPQPEKKGTNMLPVVIIILVMAAVGGGWFFMQTKKKKQAASGPDPYADYTDDDED